MMSAFKHLEESVTLFDQHTAERALQEAKALTREGELTKDQLARLRHVFNVRFKKK